MKSEQLVLTITPAQLGRTGINCEVPLSVSLSDLPTCFESDPYQAIKQLGDRDEGKIRVALTNAHSVVASHVAAVIACAVHTDNPALTVSRAIDRLGLPEGEMKEAVQALAYQQDPRLRGFLTGAITAKQINGQIKGNPEARKLIDQLALVDGRPARRSSVQVASFDDLPSVSPAPALAGKDLEMRCAMALDAAGLEYDPRRRRTGTLKLFAEQAEVDFRVTTGIEDPSGLWREGFIVECKNRTSDRTPDQDLLYALYNITRFYTHPTIVVLETNNQRVHDGAKRFFELESRNKKAGPLLAILNFGQFQQWCMKRTGSIA